MPEGVTSFLLRRVETRVGAVAIVTIDNGADHTRPTTFGRAAFASLARLLPELEREGWAGLILTGKPFVFAAGADLDELRSLSTPEAVREAGRIGHEAF